MQTNPVSRCHTAATPPLQLRHKSACFNTPHGLPLYRPWQTSPQRCGRSELGSAYHMAFLKKSDAWPWWLMLILQVVECIIDRLTQAAG